MRYGTISSCVTGFIVTVVLSACAAQVDDPSSVPQKDEVTASPHVAPAATTAHPEPTGPTCFNVYCTSNATCEALCHEPSSKCVDRHCYVP